MRVSSVVVVVVVVVVLVVFSHYLWKKISRVRGYPKKGARALGRFKNRSKNQNSAAKKLRFSHLKHTRRQYSTMTFISIFPPRTSMPHID